MPKAPPESARTRSKHKVPPRSKSTPAPSEPPAPTKDQRFALACAYILDQLSEGRPLKEILRDVPLPERPDIPAPLPSRLTPLGPDR